MPNKREGVEDPVLEGKPPEATSFSQGAMQDHERTLRRVAEEAAKKMGVKVEVRRPTESNEFPKMGAELGRRRRGSEHDEDEDVSRGRRRSSPEIDDMKEDIGATAVAASRVVKATVFVLTPAGIMIAIVMFLPVAKGVAGLLVIGAIVSIFAMLIKFGERLGSWIVRGYRKNRIGYDDDGDEYR